MGSIEDEVGCGSGDFDDRRMVSVRFRA